MSDADNRIDRREFLKGCALGTILVTPGLPRRWTTVEPGRLTARLGKPSSQITSGDHVLFDEDGRRGILCVPTTYDPGHPAPFFMALHGATGSGDSMLRGTRAAAEAHGAIVLAPSSHGTTWDAIRGAYGDDLTRIDHLLADAFDRCAVDPAHVAIGGFSDGATYALSVGLTNGDVFTHVVAHSPGFVIPGVRRGKPKVFISHGRQDRILPIEQCGARIAANLKRDGYPLRFDEFDGGHTASPEVRAAAMGWFVGS